ncbi:restriction endonuclease subunit S [Chloroflexi bacterium CFX6]|nr:restriction endonuclease subunit S [Chloroflexi bacterium CFX6]
MSRSSWKEVELDSIADVVLGGTPSTAIPEYWIPEIDWVTAKDISETTTAKIHKTERMISKLGLEKSPAKILPSLTTVIIARGATMGKCRMLGRAMALKQTCYGMIAREKYADPIFLYYYLSNLYDHFRAMAHGTIFDTVIGSGLRALKINLPPLPEQRAIAGILGALDDKIELNRRMNRTLESMARAVFRQWFVEDEEIGDWEIGKLGDVAENIRRSANADEIEPETHYIGLEHMPRGSIALSEWGNASELASNKFIFKEGEFLFGKLRPYFHKVGIAPIDGVCSTDILVIAPKSPEWYGFVLGHISSVELINYTNAASTGTKMPRTNWTDIAHYEVVIPPMKLAKDYNEIFLPMAQRIRANIKESRTLASLRDSLLPRLMRGEVRVK